MKVRAEREVGEACTVHDGLGRLVQLLPRVVRALRRQPNAKESVGGVVLGPRHSSALALIRERELTVGQLAAALGLTLATVSGLVGDLEQVGFAERSTDPRDRRRILVRVEPGRVAYVDAWLEGATAPLMRALQRLDDAERSAFIKGLGYLEAELNRSTAAEGIFGETG